MHKTEIIFSLYDKTSLIYLWQLSTDSAYLQHHEEIMFKSQLTLAACLQMRNKCMTVPKFSEMVRDLVCRVAHRNSLDGELNARKAEKEKGL